MRFGSFVRFGVLSSVQPQNVAMRHFGSFGNMGRQPTTFGPRGTPCALVRIVNNKARDPECLARLASFIL